MAFPTAEQADRIERLASQTPTQYHWTAIELTDEPYGLVRVTWPESQNTHIIRPNGELVAWRPL